MTFKISFLNSVLTSDFSHVVVLLRSTDKAVIYKKQTERKRDRQTNSNKGDGGGHLFKSA